MNKIALTAAIAAGLLSLAVSEVMAQSARGVTSAPVFFSCADSTNNPGTVNTPCMGIAIFSDSADSIGRIAVVRGSGAKIRFDFARFNAVAVLVPNDRAYFALVNAPNITRVVADRRVRYFARPEKCTPWPSCRDGGSSGGNDQTVSKALQRIGAAPSDNLGVDGSNVIVAVLDSGVDLSHTDMLGNLVAGATCLGAYEGALNSGSDCDSTVGAGDDDHGHGTHVAGIIAAADNDADTVGVAPKAKIMPVKVLDSEGYGFDSNIMAGLNFARTNGAHVVNLSLGGDGDCLAGSAPASLVMLKAEIDLTIQAGITVVVAAGNDRTQTIADVSPAGCPGVISVTSSTAQDGTSRCKVLPNPVLADTGSFFTTDGDPVSGRQPAVAAPGANRENLTCGSIKTVGVTSLAMGGGTTEKSGTSMSSPHVAGVVALLIDKADNGCGQPMSPADIAGYIANGAVLQGSAPYPNPYVSHTDDGVREGILNAPGALSAQGC